VLITFGQGLEQADEDQELAGAAGSSGGNATGRVGRDQVAN
jgi:hypothetical protein